jgi:hypothetical protein
VGLRRGGVIAPTSTKRSAAQVVRDRPAVAHGALVRGNLNVSNLRMIAADARVQMSASFFVSKLRDRPDTAKSDNQSQS